MITTSKQDDKFSMLQIKHDILIIFSLFLWFGFWWCWFSLFFWGFRFLLWGFGLCCWCFSSCCSFWSLSLSTSWLCRSLCGCGCFRSCCCGFLFFTFLYSLYWFFLCFLVFAFCLFRSQFCDQGVIIFLKFLGSFLSSIWISFLNLLSSDSNISN